MQRWEYMYIYAYKNDVREINGKIAEYGKGSLPTILNEYGKQGWEAVGIDYESSEWWRILLKLPLNE
jgi:hypothetical protein